MQQIERHPFSPFVPERADKLVLGSFPPYRIVHQALKLGDINWYYGSRNNLFWRLLEQVYRVEFGLRNPDKEIPLLRIRAFCTEHGFGLADMLSEVIRLERRSSDSDLRPMAYLDIVELLVKHPSLRSIYCTSQFVWQLLRNTVRASAPSDYQFTKTSAELHELQLFDNNYLCRILLSPSPNALKGLVMNSEYKLRSAQNPGYTPAQFRLDKYKEGFLSVTD